MKVYRMKPEFKQAFDGFNQAVTRMMFDEVEIPVGRFESFGQHAMNIIFMLLYVPTEFIVMVICFTVGCILDGIICGYRSARFHLMIRHDLRSRHSEE